MERIKTGVRDIDARVSKVSQTATRIGDRLQVGWECYEWGDKRGSHSYKHSRYMYPIGAAAVVARR